MNEPDYMVGITAYGERLRFEGWVYRAYLRNELRDPALRMAVQRVVEWRTWAESAFVPPRAKKGARG